MHFKTKKGTESHYNTAVRLGLRKDYLVSHRTQTQRWRSTPTSTPLVTLYATSGPSVAVIVSYCFYCRWEVTKRLCFDALGWVCAAYLNDEAGVAQKKSSIFTFVKSSVKIFSHDAVGSRWLSQSFKRDTLKIKADVQNLWRRNAPFISRQTLNIRGAALLWWTSATLWTLVTWLKKKHVRRKNPNDTPLPVFPALKKLKLVFLKAEFKAGSMKGVAEWNVGTAVLKGRWEMRDPSVWLWCDFKRLCLKRQALMPAW